MTPPRTLNLPSTLRRFFTWVSRRIEAFAHTMGGASLVAIPLTFVLLWARLNPVLNTAFTADSYGYFLIGDNFARHGEFVSSAIRDFHGPRVFPQPSRSFPPAWPITVGLFSRLTGLGITAGVVANAFVLVATLAAFWWLARIIAGSQTYLFFSAFPLLVLSDREFQLELAAGRSVPMAVFWYLLCLGFAWRWLNSKPLTRAYSLLTGIAIAGLTLSRSDQLFFGGFCLLALPLRVLMGDRRQGLREAAWAWGGFALVWFPWALRNLVVFGTPLASDNALSAASTVPGVYGYFFFAPGHIPPTLREAPSLWVEQRWGYLKVNANIIYQFLLPLLPPVGLVIGLSWSRLQVRDRILGGILAANILLTTLAISMTSFHDRRYFTPVFLSFGIFAALALCRILSHHRITAWVFAACAWLLILVVAWPDVPRAASNPGGLRADLLGPRISPLQAAYADLTPAIKGITGARALVAAPWAEELTYYTGLRSIYTPLNIATHNADFDAWLAEWRPDYIWADPPWVRQMGLESWAVAPQPPTGWWIGWMLLKTQIPGASPYGPAGAAGP